MGVEYGWPFVTKYASGMNRKSGASMRLNRDNMARMFPETRDYKERHSYSGKNFFKRIGQSNLTYC